ncbi:hydrolase [Sphingorhabdus lutea]|uniref:Hydrolase n=2 Tax=Sphingorhabdus lutea TaxID=1913578 RepID=A0A1L3JEJ9_9SPHN|nr:hydrolase [Sphingorhabdus lutea]
MPIKNVIFDVGKVLFNWDLRHLFRKHIMDTEELEFFVTHVVTPEWHFQHDAGRPLADMVVERIAEFPEYADLIRLYSTHFNETIPGPVEHMPELVAKLVQNNVPLYAITNFGAEFWDGFVVTQPIFDHFGGIIVSGAEKLLKPDPAIYQLALSRFKLNAPQCIFIDDLPANVAAAKKLGMAGHIFTDAGTLEQKLHAIGLL